jgi:hypothetical protein
MKYALKIGKKVVAEDLKSKKCQGNISIKYKEYRCVCISP